MIKLHHCQDASVLRARRCTLALRVAALAALVLAWPALVSQAETGPGGLGQLTLVPLGLIEQPAPPGAEPDPQPRDPYPMFGHVVQGRGAFHSDFVIDCDGHTFNQVPPGGGRYARRGGRLHSGIDIRIRDGEFLCYGRDHEAKVVYLGFENEDAVVVDHDCGWRAGNCVVIGRRMGGDYVKTVFAHLKKSFVEPGQSVRRGDVIGIVGKSGRVTGPHLHYEKHVNGRSVRLSRIDRQRF
jgi:murein DD-endopeptidase MepM/ murein hydrolase activator NlpD